MNTNNLSYYIVQDVKQMYYMTYNQILNGGTTKANYILKGSTRPVAGTTKTVAVLRYCAVAVFKRIILTI
jgi:hypothetical protein